MKATDTISLSSHLNTVENGRQQLGVDVCNYILRHRIALSIDAAIVLLHRQIKVSTDHYGRLGFYDERNVGVRATDHCQCWR